MSANSSGVKAAAQAGIALSSTGISMIIPRSRSGARAATSSVTLAPSEVPPDDGLLELEMVEQRHRLAGELGHRVAAHLIGAVRLAVPEEVERHHAVAVGGQVGGQRRLHLLGEEQSRAAAPWCRGPCPWIV